MGKKAFYGALMGLGEGISTYGGMLATQAVENKKIDRQASIEEIRQRFKLQVTADDRMYKAGLLDDEYQREEDILTPGHPLYESRETQRQLEQEGKQANAVALRKMPYGGSSGILADLNQSQWTPDSFRAFMAEVNQLVESGMTPEEAQRIASGTTPLVPKPPTAASDTANLNKSVRDAVALFTGKADMIKVEMLVDLGHPREVMETLSTLQLIEEFKRAMMSVMAMPEQGGLMNAAPVSNGGPPDLQTDPMGWLNSP